ncbi:MAG: zinc-ribbon domain-containing protein [Asgard group archaeon]|nr:zinc-ribbon domain-containing protein [Asgard group archaeon]
MIFNLIEEKKMAEEIKYNICANCGAIVEKDVQFCGHCGAQVQVKQEPAESSQPYAQPGYQQTYQPTQPVYDKSRADAESRLRIAHVLAWLGCLGTILSIVAIVLALDTKKTLGEDPRIKRTVTIAIVMIALTVLISIGGSVAYVIIIMNLGYF